MSPRPPHRKGRSPAGSRLARSAAPPGSGSGASLISPAQHGPESFADAAPISNESAFNILAYGLGPLIPAAEFPLRVTLADTVYLETPPEFVLASIATDPILSASTHYRDDVFDCDDYVLYLKVRLSLYAATNRLQAPLAVGFIFTTEHAFSFCIAGGSRLILVNTQSATHAVESQPGRFGPFLAIRPGNRITTVYL